MRKFLYAVRDDLTKEFNDPMGFITEIEAMRAFANSLIAHRQAVEKNPHTTPIFADTKTIFFIGTYEDGEIIPEKTELCRLSLAEDRYKQLLSLYNGD